MKKILPGILCFLFIIVVYRSWFTPGILSKGDNHFVLASMYSNYTLEPQAWDTDYGYGMGRPTAPTLWNSFLNNIPIIFFGNIFHFDWQIIERVAYFFPVLLISIFAAYRLNQVTRLNKSYWYISSVIVLLNTYFLMVAAGQILVALAVSFSIIVVAQGLSFFESIFVSNKKFFSKASFFKTCIFTLLLVTLIHLDLRIFYVATLGIFLLFVILTYLRIVSSGWLESKKGLYRLLLHIFLVGGLIAILNSYWLYPLIGFSGSQFQDPGGAYISTNAVKFFSFANFEHALGLLHPNWPENIFGKTSFMKPEFLLLPLLAFSSLLFINKKKDYESQYIVAFVVIGLLGIFLAKGAQDPFGNVYIWLFNYIPGFVMFRDPTKWYVLIILSYSVLIPYAISSFFTLLKAKIPHSQKIVIVLMLASIAFLGSILFPAIKGQLSGSFHPSSLPEDYKNLNLFLNNEKDFSRTIWIPATYRYGFTSPNHPAIGAQDYFMEYNKDKLLSELQKPSTLIRLQQSAIKYVIVPFDSERDLFIEDRGYSEKLYKKVLTTVSQIKGFEKVSGFSQLGIYRVPAAKGHFWTKTKSTLSTTRNSATDYTVKIENGKENEMLVFSESFDAYWIAKVGDTTIQSKNFHDLNSFSLPRNGSYHVDVIFSQQEKVKVGLWASILGFIAIIVYSGLYLGQKYSHQES